MANNFGGLWTKKKLNILADYLNFYTTALKNKKFKKIYIDCFAGSGEVFTRDEELIEGSAQIALDIDNKFDEYYFIEMLDENIAKLNELKEKHKELKINIIKGDCNIILPQILEKINWKFDRAVLFIDPYATQFKYSTLEKVAATKAIDVWYLFPYSAINRLLTKDGNIDESWSNILTECLGTEDWKTELYKESTQMNLFGNEDKEKLGKQAIQEYIFNRMSAIFSYVSPEYIELKNKNNSPLFLLFLLISSDNIKAKALVKRVERYILKK